MFHYLLQFLSLSLELNDNQSIDYNEMMYQLENRNMYNNQVDNQYLNQKFQVYIDHIDHPKKVLKKTQMEINILMAS